MKTYGLTEEEYARLMQVITTFEDEIVPVTADEVAAIEAEFLANPPDEAVITFPQWLKDMLAEVRDNPELYTGG